MIFRLCKTWEVYAWLRIVLSVPRKCVIVWFPDGVDRHSSGMLLRGWAVAPKHSVPAIKKVSSLFSLADCALENQFSTHKNWI